MYKIVLLLAGPFTVIMLVVKLYYRISLFQQAKLDIESLLYNLKENKLEKYIKDVYGDKLTVVNFQLIRVIIAFLCGAIVYISQGIKVSVISMVIVYLMMYLYLYLQYNQRIAQINRIMPYYMKMLINLCYSNPVNNALVKSLDYSDKIFSYRLQQMIEQLDEDPISYIPYQKFINSYDNRINNLNQYFKSLYRISLSGNSEGEKLLENLNKSISEQISQVRKEKNKIINDTVGYLGLLPVGLLVVVLTYILVLSLSLI